MKLFKKEPEFYNLDKILEYQALYNIIYSERSNGKSYAVKKWCLEQAYKQDDLFCLVFRFKSDKSRNSDIKGYFSDAPIESITEGEYSGVEVRSGLIYFTYEDEDGKVKRGKQCGFVANVQGEEAFKSLPFEGCCNIIYEEFISKSHYLIDEVRMFENLVSTILRLRLNYQLCRVFLIGNTLSQVSPYKVEWNLYKMPTQKSGTIDIYNITTETGHIKIACEFCPHVNNQGGIAITQKGQALEKGLWEVDNFNTFSFKENKEKFEEKYHFIYTYLGLYFMCRFLVEKNKNNSMFIYVEKLTKSIKEDERVIGDIYSTSALYTQDFTPLVERERVIFNLLKQGKVAFCDNLTGTNFYTCYNTMKKNKL